MVLFLTNDSTFSLYFSLSFSIVESDLEDSNQISVSDGSLFVCHSQMIQDTIHIGAHFYK